ncbi:MAG TPA: recombinase family protein [Jatrophihabitans sp.]|jgi:DNA invertase Pin-like site-specific DNA recombinase
MTTTSARAALYVRVSQDRNRRHKSVNEQEAELRQVAADEGWEVVAVFSDNDRSASRYAVKDRPGYRDLLEFIAQGKADLVATWENSRLTRDLGEFVAMAKVCEGSRTRWYYGGTCYDLTKASDRRRVGHDMVDSSAESDVTRERVLRSVRSSVKAGTPHGRQCYGYRRVYDEQTGALDHVEIHAERAAILREAAAHVLAGGSLYQLARDLDARGVPTMTPNATRWHASNLTRALKSPVYMGKRVHRGEVVGDAVWPAIFDSLTWTRLQAVMGDPARNTRPETATRHLLSGLMTCGKCEGTAFYVLTAARSRGGKRAYTCRDCQSVARLVEPVDELVNRVAVELLSRPAFQRAWARPTDADALESAQAEAEAAEAELADLYAAVKAKRLSVRALAELEPGMAANVETTKAEVSRLLRGPGVLDGVTPAEIASRWDGLDIDTKRRVLRELFRIRLLPVGRGRRVFDPASVEIKPSWQQ